MCLQSVDKFLMETPSIVRPVPSLHDCLVWPGAVVEPGRSSVLASTAAPANCSQMLTSNYYLPLMHQ